jgi:hypothetical protein
LSASSKRQRGASGIVAGVESLRCERGLTLIEVVVTAAILMVGMLGTFSAFTGAKRTTLAAQHREVAVHQAQREIEKLTTRTYAQLKLTAQPQASLDPANPGSRVIGAYFKTRPDLTEPLVLPSDPGPSGLVSPGPEPFSVAAGNSVVSGNVYRYVTWRDEHCTAEACAGTQNTKRVIVAVTIDGSDQRAGPRRPIFMSWIATDPNAGSSDTEQAPDATPGSGPQVTAESFFLYDTRCGFGERQLPADDHPTHNTASVGTTASEDSTCENSDASRQPDLMGPVAPPNPVEPDVPPLLRYSDDLTGSYPGGLALERGNSTCPTSYPAADAESTNATSKWKVHAWATAPMASAFELTGRVSLSFYTTTVGGAAGRGMVCATVIDRVTSNGVPTDTALGAITYDVASWPTTPRHLSFTFDLPHSATVGAGHRLVLALSVRGESANDLVLLYDHPVYQSFLQTATTTPL